MTRFLPRWADRQTWGFAFRRAAWGVWAFWCWLGWRIEKGLRWAQRHLWPRALAAGRWAGGQLGKLGPLLARWMPARLRTWRRGRRTDSPFRGKMESPHFPACTPAASWLSLHPQEATKTAAFSKVDRLTPALSIVNEFNHFQHRDEVFRQAVVPWLRPTGCGVAAPRPHPCPPPAAAPAPEPPGEELPLKISPDPTKKKVRSALRTAKTKRTTTRKPVSTP